MPEDKAKKIADAAEMVVGGYAMFRHKQGFRIVSIFSGHVLVVSKEFETLATDMDDIEATIAVARLRDNLEFMAA